MSLCTCNGICASYNRKRGSIGNGIGNCSIIISNLSLKIYYIYINMLLADLPISIPYWYYRDFIFIKIVYSLYTQGYCSLL